MIYLLKFILCSSLLYAFYHWVLRNEKLFRFNRFFLIGIVILSVSIPLVTVQTKIIEAQPMVISTYADEQLVNSSIPKAFESAKANIAASEILIVIYGVVTLFLIYRLVRNLLFLRSFRRDGELTFYDGTSVILRHDISQSFSFLNHIYSGTENYRKGQLPIEILEHEKAHIDQKHSYDIIFIESMLCLFWFNPILYQIRKSIKLNHEFLADEAVLSNRASLNHYQKIIINYASQQQLLQPVLASHLSFGETKQRIQIMVKTKNKTLNFIRQTTALAIIMSLFALLGKTEIIAQQVVPPPPPPTNTATDQSNKTGTVVLKSQTPQDSQIPAPPRLIRFHVKSLVSYKNENDKKVEATFEELPEQIQKDFLDGKLKDGKIWMPPPPKRPLTESMLKEYQNSNTYGVWVDNLRVENTALENYNPDDFHHFYKSKLYKGASHYGQYTYQITLVTNQAIANKEHGRWVDAKVGKMSNQRVRKLELGNE